MTKRKNIWIIAAKFPNTIQPWLANSVIQAAEHNNEVSVISTQLGDKVYANRLDELGLISNTIYLPLAGKDRRANIIRNFTLRSRFHTSLSGFFKASKLSSKYRKAASNLISSLNLAPYINDHNIDLIHCHSEPAGHQLLPLVRAQQCPVVITFHGLPPVGVRPLSEGQRQEYTSLASAILVNTEFARQQYISLGADSEKLQIIPQGTDTKRFAFSEKSDPKNAPIELLSVGRFHPDKGHKYALEAVANLIHKGHKLEYTLVGSGPDRQLLENLAREMDIENQVHFLSGISEDKLIEQYRKAHIFLFPSVRSKDGFHEETQGVALQEAQSCGAIVITTKTGGIPECVNDGENAFLVDDRSSTAIQTQLETLLNNTSEWPKIRIAAREWVEKHYDVSVIGDKMEMLYQALTQNSNTNDSQ